MYFIEDRRRRNTYVSRMATNDEILLKLTASKMNIHRSTRLETIATQSIVRNLDSFLDPQYSETRNLMLLPSALRNIVLQQWLMRQFAQLKNPRKRYLPKNECIKILEKRIKVFQSLVSCHTLEVNLTPFIEDCCDFLAREHLLKYLNLIVDKATNLKVLVIMEDVENLRELDGTLCDAVGEFRNLLYLNIWNIDITYTNLKETCKNLKSLTHLVSTRIHFHPNFDESNEREIEELRIFSNLIVFQTDGRNDMFTLNCIQHLPKLQYIDYCTTSIVEELIDRCPNQKFATTRIELTAPPNKEIHLNFPDVYNLVVRYHHSDGSIIPNFSKIQHLTLLPRFLSVDTMVRFLDAYGHGLYSLNINHISGQFKLSSILDRCPKLLFLYLDSISILPECSRPDVHSFLTGLVVFEFRCRSDVQEPLLLDILSVPTLQSVTLNMSCEHFHLEDIEKLTAMIASRQILGNLRRLHLFVINMERDNNHHVFRALSDFIKSASAFLPHLTDLETNILSEVQIGYDSEASLEVATLNKVIEVYENYNN